MPKISLLPSVAKMRDGTFFVVVDEADGGTKKIAQGDSLKSENAMVITSDFDDPAAIEIEATDEDGGVKILINGLVSAEFAQTFTELGPPDILSLGVPKGFNASLPGVVPTDYRTDEVGFNWFGNPGVDSQLSIAGRIHCLTGTGVVEIPGGIKEIGSPLFLYKSTNQIVNNNDTPIDDDELLVALTATQQFAFKIVAMISVSGPGSGIAVGLGGDLVAANLIAGAVVYDNVTNIATPLGMINGLFSYVGLSSLSSGDHWLVIEGTAYVTTGGTLAFQWAQAVADAVDLIVLQGSSMQITKLTIPA